MISQLSRKAAMSHCSAKAGDDGNTAHLVNNAGITGNTAWQGSWRSDATLELDSLKCN